MSYFLENSRRANDMASFSELKLRRIPLHNFTLIVFLEICQKTVLSLIQLQMSFRLRRIEINPLSELFFLWIDHFRSIFIAAFWAANLYRLLFITTLCYGRANINLKLKIQCTKKSRDQCGKQKKLSSSNPKDRRRKLLSGMYCGSRDSNPLHPRRILRRK